MANRNVRNNAAAVDAAVRLIFRARDDVVQVLLEVGFLTGFMAAIAAGSRPAVSVLAYPPAYLGTLVVFLIVGLSTMWAAGWVAGDPARRRAAGWMILFAYLFLMAMAVPELFFDILGAIA
ncbi:unnamed protein product [Miscanthus lutarioriparius]|uniref:Uncharacterized protein n=1 Tax=Miscanthus lutarioriparius TaxID=422564 RepID=A0A811P232_9POAL|nr:unnamed protein product [Miscanthus lutarioriparius]